MLSSLYNTSNPLLFVCDSKYQELRCAVSYLELFSHNLTLFVLFYNSQFTKVAFNLFVKVSTFGFQFLDFSHDSLNVDRLFLFKGIHITGNVQIVVVIGYFLQGGEVAVLFYLGAIAVSIYNLVDMLLA